METTGRKAGGDPAPTGTPKVSVLMPVYNAGRHVAEATRSILARTFGDFEFLIVDDGSTDRSRSILERFAAEDPRIRLVSRPNTGYLVALDQMLGRARGELVARMDADDVALPDRFARQVRHLDAHADCVLGAEVLRRWGWWALGSGHVGTARRHALASLARQPFAKEAWNLVAGAFRGRRSGSSPFKAPRARTSAG